MSEAPPPYGRIPHLAARRGTRDDLDLPAEAILDLLAGEVVVEEKLDGANVALWLDDEGQVDAALRSGPGGMDRARQLGPLRAWAAAHDDGLRAILGRWPVIYAEWLLVAHSTAYDRLPSYLIILDLADSDGRLATVDERNRVCSAGGLLVPPELWRGRPWTVVAVEGLMGTSAWGTQPMEGVVVRRLGDGSPRVAKLVRSGFHILDDGSWRAGRPHNRLGEGAAAWR